MENVVLKRQVSQLASVILAIWGFVSLLGRLVNLAGPDFFWEIFIGAKAFNKIIFVPIPDGVEDLVFYTGFQALNLVSVVTVGMIAVALASLSSKDNKLLTILLGLAGFHVFTSIQQFIDLAFDENARYYLGFFTIVRWTVLGALIPTFGGLCLAAVLFGGKIPAVNQFFAKTAPLNIPDISLKGLQPQQEFNTQSSHSNFTSGGNMTNDNNQAGGDPGFNNPGSNFGTTSASFGANDGGSPWDLTTPLYRVQVMGSGDRLYSIGELQQMAKQKALKGNTMVQHRDAGYPVQASMVPNVFSDKQWITALLLSFFLGSIGVDRFYLGHTGLGIAKLLTLGGCGVWSLIDFILIAMRSINDAEGRPMA